MGGVIGVVCVLMEEDNVSDSGADAGHAALNNGVRDAINQIVATRTVSNQDVTDAELAGFESQITSAVSSAIQDQQNFFENLWSWLNPDDSIGFKVFLFKHDDLASAGVVDFGQRFDNEGDWKLTGTITATAICPVNVFDILFATKGKAMSPGGVEGASEPEVRKGLHADLEALRRFRDGPYRDLPGLAAWWRLAERNSPAIALALARNSELREKAAALLSYAADTCNDLDAMLDPKHLQLAADVLGELAASTRSRRLRIDASRAAEVVPMLEGRSWIEGSKALDSFKPSRHPVVNGLGMRIQRATDGRTAADREPIRL